MWRPGRVRRCWAGWRACWGPASPRSCAGCAMVPRRGCCGLEVVRSCCGPEGPPSVMSWLPRRPRCSWRPGSACPCRSCLAATTGVPPACPWCYRRGCRGAARSRASPIRPGCRNWVARPPACTRSRWTPHRCCRPGTGRSGRRTSPQCGAASRRASCWWRPRQPARARGAPGRGPRAGAGDRWGGTSGGGGPQPAAARAAGGGRGSRRALRAPV